mgnify:FL=1|jgi:hypothetical protein
MEHGVDRERFVKVYFLLTPYARVETPGFYALKKTYQDNVRRSGGVPRKVISLPSR